VFEDSFGVSFDNVGQDKEFEEIGVEFFGNWRWVFGEVGGEHGKVAVHKFVDVWEDYRWGADGFGGENTLFAESGLPKHWDIESDETENRAYSELSKTVQRDIGLRDGDKLVSGGMIKEVVINCRFFNWIKRRLWSKLLD
jgi:hypothetical protein